MKNLWIFIIIAFLLVVVVYLNPLDVQTRCLTDADCVPAQCCHPTSCVAAAKKPNCEGIACTEECRPGTMDCGCGSCLCVDGQCQVEFVTSDFCSR